MKNIKLYVIYGAMSFLAGCEVQNDTSSERLSSDECPHTEVVNNIANKKGRILLDTTANVYKLYSGIDGSYDSQDVGVICNLPKQFQKDDIEVLFSGTYYKYDGQIKKKLPGQKFYYLELTQIKSLN